MNHKHSHHAGAAFSGWCFIVLLTVAAATLNVAGQEYSWQKPHVTVLPNGDLEWAPEPYQLIKGQEVRYIDFADGDDANSGTSPEEAWKHHPWDNQAAGNAAQVSGPATYIFKGGVIYRGQLEASHSGEPGNPIRLVTDPSWGNGRAWFWGSTRLPSAWVPATQVQVPERLPEPEKVWALNLKEVEGVSLHKNGVEMRRPGMIGDDRPRTTNMDPTYTGLHIVRADGQFEALHLARTPDWQPMGENFAMDFWHTTDAEVRKEIGKGFSDDIWAGKGLPQDYFDGGYIWIGYRSLMGTPTPAPMSDQVGNEKKGFEPYFYPEEGAIMKWVTPYGHGKGGLPYMIENLPQFLDAPGEFYLDAPAGILYLRLAEGQDPNQLHLEFTTEVNKIEISNQSHIEIAGLGFAFNHGTTIDMRNSVQDVNIHHCEFRNVLDECIAGYQFIDQEEFHTMDKMRVTDNLFVDIGTSAILFDGRDGKWHNREGWENAHRGELIEVDILRNKTLRTGIRHRSSRWSNVPAIRAVKFQRGEIAGNIIERCFGSGIMVLGGKEGNLGSYENRAVEHPLIRIFVHHNKTDDTALGVNDYGGLALWQGGPTYAYSNNVGNSPGHMPAGLFGGTRALNLSYPLYLDGAFKQYCFNNIIWGRTTDPDDPYANTTPGYFMVFGFLNQFTNNTLYRQSEGIGGSSGNRNDIVSNVFAEVNDKFIASNRIGDPSLAGGGDDASSGLRGIPSLAYTRNFFHGAAEAGYLVREKEMERAETLSKMIDAETIEQMSEQMQDFPIRIGLLGEQVAAKPVKGAPNDEPIIELTQEVDFHPTPDSPVIDAGGAYFIPFSLYGTVGEWNFTENHADPATVVDYHFYFAQDHFHRMLYEQIPAHDLNLSSAGLEDYVSGPSEDWVNSAMVFDGQRFGRVTDAFMREDIKISLGRVEKDRHPGEPWKLDQPSGENGKYTAEDFARYPGNLRKSLVIDTQNLLIDVIFQAEAGSQGVIAGKHDGSNGYSLRINEQGQAEFAVAGSGQSASVATSAAVNDGQWHYVLAEIDRETGRMSIYLDGKPSGEAKADLPADASIDNNADFLVGKAADDSGHFTGAIDFLRVCRGTLEDSHTDIAEVYEWQTNGPFRYDFFGNTPKGRRDAGAIEAAQEG